MKYSKRIFSKIYFYICKHGWKILAFLIGLAITSIVYAIPFAGWLVQFTGILFGFGGPVMITKGWLSSGQKNNQINVY